MSERLQRRFSPTFAIVALVLLVASLTSCSSRDAQDGSAEQKATASPSPTPIFNSISGKFGKDDPVLAVKIDDTQPARPQIGLRDADVVYIEQVEGGVTRLAAIYSSSLPRQIGPVRSARISDMELLAQYGKVAFAFSGAQRKLRPVIDSANLFNVGAEREPASVYSRDKTRRPPWNMILDPEALFERINKRELDVATAKNMGWKFAPRTPLGKKIESAKVKWPGARYQITWSQESDGWLLEQNGTSKIDASGAPIVASTFVAQVVSITNSEYGDKFGEITPLVTTVGSGRAFIFRNGRVIPGSWSRPTADSGTTFTTDDGQGIPFVAGQIWFALVAQAPEITYPPEPVSSASASPSATK